MTFTEGPHLLKEDGDALLLENGDFLRIGDPYGYEAVEGAISSLVGGMAKKGKRPTLAGVIATITGALVKKAKKVLAGAIVAITGALVKKTKRALSGAISSIVGGLVKKVKRALIGYLSSSNNIPNMWFEGALPAGWWYWSDNGTGSQVWTSEDSHSGSGCSKVVCGNTTGDYIGSGYHLSVPAGATAYVTGWVKCSNTAANKIGLMFSEITTYATKGWTNFTATGDWQFICVQWTNPAATNTYRWQACYQYADSSTVVYTDDVHMFLSPLSKKAKRPLSGAISSIVGGLVKKTKRALAGAISTIVGGLAKKAKRALAGAISTVTGALTRAADLFRSLAGVVSTITGGLVKKPFKVLAGSISSIVGGIVKKTKRALGGALIPLGSIYDEIQIALYGYVVTITGGLSKKTFRALAGSITSIVGGMAKKIKRALSGVIKWLVGVVTGVTVSFTYGEVEAPNEYGTVYAANRHGRVEAPNQYSEVDEFAIVGAIEAPNQYGRVEAQE